ncbi:hypothetical protein QTP88_007061 [Uroleucon formosanum]
MTRSRYHIAVLPRLRFVCLRSSSSEDVLFVFGASISQRLLGSMSLSLASFKSVGSFVAFLAISSAISLPGMLLCPGTHRNLMSFLDKNIMFNIKKSMYEAGRKLILTIPKSIDEAKHQLFSNQNDIIANNNKQFCFMKNNESIPIFTCYTNLVMLCEVREIFADGTFTYCPSYFYQLYTIHILHYNYYLPLIYCFLNSKSTDKYKEMWTLIKELCKKIINKEIQINKIHLDFEKSAHNIAIAESFPTAQIITCQFHLGQSWYRKIQSNNYLLYQYKNNTEIGLWLKYFFGLAFLPPEQFDDGFVELISIALTDNHTFTDYILKNYINKESQFPPNIWSETPINNTRTTNGPKAFHKHFNVQFYHPHPNIHHVVDVLTYIQVETALKINSIKKNQFNYTRKEVQLKRTFLIDNWNAYDKGDITLIEYLKMMGIRYQGNKI